MVYNLKDREKRLAAKTSTISPQKARELMADYQRKISQIKKLEAEKNFLKADLVAAENDLDKMAAKLAEARAELRALKDKKENIVFEGYLTAKQIQDLTNRKK